MATTADGSTNNSNSNGHAAAAAEVSSTPSSLTVLPNGHSYDALLNGNLSPSEDSGTGMSDHGSQSSQSPNQCYIPPTTPSNLQSATSFLPPHHHHQHLHQKLVVQTGCNVNGDNSTSPNMVVFHHPNNGCADPNYAHSGQTSPSSGIGGAGFSPTASRGDSPADVDSGSATTPHQQMGQPPPPQQQQQQQHIVLVHVSHGETFSVRLGDEIQHIAGKCCLESRD